MPCYRCGRVQTDPTKGASPWGVGVVDSEQILICPQCQNDDPDWTEALETCPRCGSSRLSVKIGSLYCRQCEFLS